MWPAFVPLVASLVASVSAADVIGTGVETLDANATLRYALGGHERAGLDALFAAVDADGDGGVSLTELGTFLAFADDELELTETTAAAVRALHRAGDADTDGALSPAEFDAALVARADETSVERDLDAAAESKPRARDRRGRAFSDAPPRALPWKDGPPRDRERDARVAPPPPTTFGRRGGRRRRPSPSRALCVTGHPNTCGPCEGCCEDAEFRAVGRSVEEARRNAAIIGGFLRRRGASRARETATARTRESG